MAPAVTVGGEEREGVQREGEAGKAAAEEPLLAEEELLQMLRTLEEAKEGDFLNELLEEGGAAPPQLDEVLERQRGLQRRHDRLLRLVRRKQARNLGFHSGLQIYEMVTTSKAVMKARTAALRLHAAPDDLLDADHVNGMSPRALASLVKQIGAGGEGAQLAATLSCEQAAELRAGAGHLGQRLRHVEAALDSDVTASSSGGDSCDEAAGFSQHNTRTLPICKRAAWRFARERASAASRWSWLMANIAELEYRIRQLVDYQRQLRTNKGPITLAPSPLTNGEGEGGEGGACRVKPLDLEAFRKRKLFVPGMLTPKSGKRVCQAQSGPPCCRDSCSMPCVLCFPKKAAGAAQQQLLPPDVGGRETLRERAARLDPAIHPVLSASQDVSRSLQMAALLRQPGWQQSQLRHKGLAARLGLKKTRPPASGMPPDAAPAPPKRKYKKNNSAASALSAKLRKKAKARKKVKRVEALRNKRLEAAAEEAEAAGVARPVRRKRESSYDIDNIVIPYSMAALTRVEKLEYKEIPTPKWRLSEVGGGRKGKRASGDEGSELEDISDEAVGARHHPLEADERRKFRCVPRTQRGAATGAAPGGAARAVRRTDSRAESSGANTPDPMSPKEGGEESPLTSPRATPLPFEERKGRRRTISLQAPPEAPQVLLEEAPPFEPRRFPLSDDEWRRLDASPPPPTPPPPLPPPQVEPSGGGTLGEERAGAVSPCSSASTESALPEDDPEWTLEVSDEEGAAPDAAASAAAAASDPPYRPSARRNH